MRNPFRRKPKESKPTFADEMRAKGYHPVQRGPNTMWLSDDGGLAGIEIPELPPDHSVTIPVWPDE